MTDVIIINIYLFVLAIILAILEIQIEGPDGWAKNLPTWRPKSNKWHIRLFKKFMSGKEPTGYHMTLFSFVLLIFHLPYVFELSFTLVHWLKTMSLFFIFVIIWDFLWFVLNPHHPLKRFSREHIWWHKKWWANVPVDYYIGLLLSLVVLLPVFCYYPEVNIFNWWLLNIGLFAGEVLLTVIFTLFVLNIDNWTDKER